MDCLWIEGGERLKGDVQVPPAKNGALPLMCLALLTDEPVSFEELPQVADIRNMKNLLAQLGVKEIDQGIFQCKDIRSTKAPYELVKTMRASVQVLGPLLAREKKAEVSLPGGCAIGERPVDIHLKGFEALGAQIQIENGYIVARTEKLRGCHFRLDYPSVGATLNLLMAATLAEGESVFENVAREPEITDTCEALRKMGAQISGEGSSCLTIQGVSKLKGVRWSIQPDRIQFLTYLAAAAITQGEVRCSPYHPNTLNSVLQKFREMGCEVIEGKNEVRLRAPEVLKPFEMETAPFPGYPTDGQAQIMACATLADPRAGASIIRETVFENRFGHVGELRRMGAQIDVKGNTAFIQGVSQLSAAQVMASDLRASASLVLAGLRANGRTQVTRVYHLDRGYQSFEEKLQKLGAKVWRAKE